MRDDGPGIAQEYHGQIFEPFRRLNRSNAHCGLGLAICQKIIDAHGGKIGCESEVGIGSSFFFLLPSAAEAPDERAEQDSLIEAPDPPRNSRVANVLLIDDRDDDIMLAQAFLSEPRGMRCNFIIANDGKEGITMIRDRARKNDPIDLVLLDINMPVMNGFEMLEAVGQDAEIARTPVVMCSGSTRARDKERARALGTIGYLTKPVYFEDLQPIINRSPGIRLVQDAAGCRVLTRAA